MNCLVLIKPKPDKWIFQVSDYATQEIGRGRAGLSLAMQHIPTARRSPKPRLPLVPQDNVDSSSDG
jgi:hypothetical protein